ncbi:imidazole glycerol phosphate synthase subunit HisH [Synechocystis sp. B12]|nr:imidazole glycerol phosphate synthase subunit HisH [Synechocystis sp. B12]
MGYIAVVDYDMGNLHSVCKGLEKVGGNPLVTDQAHVIDGATAIVLPGVGSFDPAVQHLRARGLEEVLKTAIAAGKPFLGICLGSQLLFDSSEEGQETGLGIIPGQVKHFFSEPGLTIPHMGWNELQFNQPDLCLWQNLPPEPQVYFVHSYYMAPLDPQVVAASTTHGSQTIAAAIAKDNVMAVQFHPEKSSNLGLKILANFVEKVALSDI